MQQPIRFVPLMASNRLPSQVCTVPTDLGQGAIVSEAAHDGERIPGLEAPDSAELPIAQHPLDELAILLVQLGQRLRVTVGDRAVEGEKDQDDGLLVLEVVVQGKDLARLGLEREVGDFLAEHLLRDVRLVGH